MASTWLTSTTAGIYTMGSSSPIAQPAIVVPANARLVRVHYYPRYRATAQLVGASPGASLAPQYHHRFAINSTQYVDRGVHEHWSVMQQEPTAFYDTQVANRVFTLYMQLSWLDAGFAMKTSYGGPGHGTITMTGVTTFFPLGGTANFPIVYENTLRALYET